VVGEFRNAVGRLLRIGVRLRRLAHCLGDPVPESLDLHLREEVSHGEVERRGDVLSGTTGEAVQQHRAIRVLADAQGWIEVVVGRALGLPTGACLPHDEVPCLKGCEDLVERAACVTPDVDAMIITLFRGVAVRSVPGRHPSLLPDRRVEEQIGTLDHRD
jgi:hypothetical protein